MISFTSYPNKFKINEIQKHCGKPCKKMQILSNNKEKDTNFFLSNLGDNSVIATPNERMAIYVANEFTFPLRKQKNLPLPKVLSFSSFLEKLWRESSPSLLLLSEAQEHALWSCIIASNFIIEKVKSAFDTLIQWNLTLEELENYVTQGLLFSPEVSQFQKWAIQFSNLLKNKNFLTKSLLPKTLCTEITKLKTPSKLLLIGFEEFSLTPAQKLLLTTLENNNTAITHLSLNNIKSTETSRMSFATQNEEIKAMANWATKTLIQNPKASIGCVVPTLLQDRSKIIRAFNSASKDKKILFNISAGKNLKDYPMIQTALTILQLAKATSDNKDDHEKLLFLLDSPFLTNPKPLEHYKTEAHNSDLKIQGKTLPSLWAEMFTKYLELMGWPGTLDLNSEDLELIARWQEALEEFKNLDLVTKEISYHIALQELESIAAKTIFQPKNDPKQINILGVLETLGINFDYLWIMGANNNNFPSSPKPNPFLPIELQKKFNMPHATFTQELHFSKLILKRFSESAPNIIFSFAKENNGQNLTLSSLLQKVPEISLNLDTLRNSKELQSSESCNSSIVEAQYLASNASEPLDDTKFFANHFGPKLELEENITGKADILKQQARCPFQAFVTYRLKAKPLIKQKHKQKILRGELIHKTLELIWKELKTQENLLQLGDDSLEKLIVKTTEKAILATQNTQEYKYSSDFFAREKKCLTRLIKDWLQYEKTRANFTVSLLEKNAEVTLGELPFKLRIDRIDKEGDFTTIIDYKTGKKAPNVKGWFDERLEEPQLPLYCLAVNSAKSFDNCHVGSIKLAHVNLKTPYHNKLKGKSKIENPEEWNKLLTDWQINLTKLAHDFCAGNAKIDPKKQRETCEKCEFGALCRIEN